jgi:hypothetical protein
MVEAVYANFLNSTTTVMQKIWIILNYCNEITTIDNQTFMCICRLWKAKEMNPHTFDIASNSKKVQILTTWQR